MEVPRDGQTGFAIQREKARRSRNALCANSRDSDIRRLMAPSAPYVADRGTGLLSCGGGETSCHGSAGATTELSSRIAGDPISDTSGKSKVAHYAVRSIVDAAAVRFLGLLRRTVE